MLHLLQNLGDGKTQLVDAPVPRASGAGIVVESRSSVISAGTERMLVEFGRAGWLGKVRAQPEKAMQVIEKMRTDGLMQTIDAVRSRLATPIPLGYCNAGIVVDVGPDVGRFAVGDRVVTNGPHAEYVRVAETLAARIPADVGFETAAFAPLGAIGLHGLRLAAPTLGETVVVYGLGLIGLLTVQLARVSGCRVIAIDRSAARCDVAERFGARSIVAVDEADLAAAVLSWTGGVGADIVLLTLATDSDEPIRVAAQMARKRGRIVLVGVTGLAMRRDDMYKKELSFQVSCSFGPGRYDPLHEQRGIDYPLPYVRWTEARNFEAVLQLMAEARLDPTPLVTHRFPINEAPAAYELIASGLEGLGIVLTYPGHTEVERAAGVSVMTTRAPTALRRQPVIGWIGAGQFSSRTLIPAFARAGAVLDTAMSPGGISASVAGRASGFRRATSDVGVLLADPFIDTVVVATRHDSHAHWVATALDAGKNVFCEKPLALSIGDVDRVAAAARNSQRILCVGFNRRFAPLVRLVSQRTRVRTGPLTIAITVNAGAIPTDHWTQEPSVGGGRIVGEACHFIDLARSLAGSRILTLQVVSARTPNAVLDDVSLLQLGFLDGSIATIQYIASGSSRFPKERVELFWDGKVARIDNFRRLRSWGFSVRTPWYARQDKGHTALVGAFVASVRDGSPVPIPVDEILEISGVSVRAAELARLGGGTLRFD